jgi:hypothetical protein
MCGLFIYKTSAAVHMLQTLATLCLQPPKLLARLGQKQLSGLGVISKEMTSMIFLGESNR